MVGTARAIVVPGTAVVEPVAACCRGQGAVSPVRQDGHLAACHVDLAEGDTVRPEVAADHLRGGRRDRAGVAELPQAVAQGE